MILGHNQQEGSPGGIKRNSTLLAQREREIKREREGKCGSKSNERPRKKEGAESDILFGDVKRAILPRGRKNAWDAHETSLM